MLSNFNSFDQPRPLFYHLLKRTVQELPNHQVGTLCIADEYEHQRPYLVGLVFVQAGKREQNEVELVNAAFRRLFTGEVDVLEVVFEKTIELEMVNIDWISSKSFLREPTEEERRAELEFLKNYIRFEESLQGCSGPEEVERAKREQMLIDFDVSVGSRILNRFKKHVIQNAPTEVHIKHAF